MAGLTPEAGMKLLKDGSHSDFTIECKGHEFKVHKAILTVASPFFASCIEKDFREAKDNTMRFPSDEPAVIASVIRFMYTGKLSVRDLKSIWRRFEDLTAQAASEAEICTLVQVYMIADRLMMDTLRKNAHKTVTQWDTEYVRAFGTGPRTPAAHRKSLGLLVDLLKAVYDLTVEADAIRIDVTIRGMRAYFDICKTAKREDARKLLETMEDREPVGPGVALRLLAPGGYKEE